MNKRSFSLDILKMFMALMVVYLHASMKLYGEYRGGGYLGVEFFFISAGISLCESIYNQDYRAGRLLDDYSIFLRKKSRDLCLMQ